ncbi:minor capsid protein [Listeria cornellensis]|uniref:1-phosphatidylinositol phosphodiesterase n=1 Tax=Listeria cornellensis FSL F6-0969 TaxID=1265820 RepID=W7BN59_9LIST|nr:minor capsid protein [Listeria cornellensis]EUJ27322.1 1-phosphatidylinositol phosphodiesterase [Listeria cornellensis FSL F6-0969]
MIKLNIKVELGDIIGSCDKRVGKAQFALDNQVLKDSNYFAPEDTKATQDSALIHSKIGEGELAWVTPYVRQIYYNPQYNFSKDKNPNASGLWFEVAKARFLSDWVRVANVAAGGRV